MALYDDTYSYQFNKGLVGYNGDINYYSNSNPFTRTPFNITTNNGGFLNTLKEGVGTLGGIGNIMQGLAGIGNMFNAYKQYGLAKRKFAFEKAAANRNVANQAKIINNTYDNAAQVAAGMIGGKDSEGNYGYVDQGLVNAYAQKAKDKHVDGSKLG